MFNGADGVSLYYVIRGETPDPLSLSLMNPDERIIYQALTSERVEGYSERKKVLRFYIRKINPLRPNNMYYSCIRQELYKEGYGEKDGAAIDVLLASIKALASAKGGALEKELTWSMEPPPPKSIPKLFTIDDLFEYAQIAVDTREAKLDAAS